MKKIQTDSKHKAALKKVDALMKKGEKNISAAESSEILTLALEIQAYEKERYYVSPSKKLEGIVGSMTMLRSQKESESSLRNTKIIHKQYPGSH